METVAFRRARIAVSSISHTLGHSSPRCPLVSQEGRVVSNISSPWTRGTKSLQPKSRGWTRDLSFRGHTISPAVFAHHDHSEDGCALARVDIKPGGRRSHSLRSLSNSVCENCHLASLREVKLAKDLELNPLQKRLPEHLKTVVCRAPARLTSSAERLTPDQPCFLCYLLQLKEGPFVGTTIGFVFPTPFQPAFGVTTYHAE